MGRAEHQEGFLSLALHRLPVCSLRIGCLASMFLAQASWFLRGKQWSSSPEWTGRSGLLWFFLAWVLGWPELYSPGVAAKISRMCSLCSAHFPMDCTPLAVVQLRMWGPRRQLAVQPEFCQSRKMQTQCRDGCPDLSALYHIVCVRQCSRTIDLIPNLTVVLQPIKYLHWFSKYIYIIYSV